MKDLFNFALGKLNRERLKFHYLRVGKASPLIDILRQKTLDLQIKWEQNEVDTFDKYHFGTAYGDFDGALINLGIDDENIAMFRREFWENFIWKTRDRVLPLAIVVPDSNSFGSLTKGMILEALSLVRLTDRPFEIFENKEEELDNIINFLTGVSSVIYRKERPDEEEEEQTNKSTN